MNVRILFFSILLFFQSKPVFSRELVPPLDIPLILSANFGELRSNHFHSGIDFKTQGRIGLPVRSIQEGYISRISVSPSGYGRALYIDHPDGTTSVYAHLDKFSGLINKIVCDSQYLKQTFRVDMILPKDLLQVKKGELIAYGGNSGSSGGPHLHFEIRDTKSEDPMDPLPFFKTGIKDTRKPGYQSFMIYPQAGKGVVNQKVSKQTIRIVKDKAGNAVLSPSAQAWGEIGLGLKALDYMDGTSNIYGVNFVSLSVDGAEIFRYRIDRFGFSESRYINSFTDWEEWANRRSFVMKSFVDPGNDLRFIHAVNRGIVRIDEERMYKFVYILKDIYGNESRLELDIEGKKQDIPAYKPRGTYYAFDKDNHISVDEVELNIPKGNLYTDIYFMYSKKKAYTPYSSLYTLGGRIPLHSYCPLTIDIEKDIFPDKRKYGIVFVNEKKQSWIGGSYNNGKLSAGIRELGNFAVAVDSVAPVVTELKPSSWAKARKISFRVGDNLSGISNWFATLNGNFVLFELDAKTAMLFCKFDAERMKKGKQDLVLWVDDYCGNRKKYEKKIVW